jgi:hypothetical protein
MVDCDFVLCAIVVEENVRHDRCPRDHFRREPYLRHRRPRADVAMMPRRAPARSRAPANAMKGDAQSTQLKKPAAEFSARARWLRRCIYAGDLPDGASPVGKNLQRRERDAGFN